MLAQTAYAYARWSSMEQTSSSSLVRQVENTSKAIAEHGWTLAEPHLIDRGRSAYTGDNIKNGRLGEFAKRVLAGAISPGSVLVVEELDRLSRQPADVMLAWLSPLIRSGLTIFVTQTGQIIDSKMLDHDMGGLMMLLITAFGSNTESRKKAERIGAAWKAKRDDAREGKDVQRKHHAPHWLDAVDGSFVAVPEKAEIVRSIFAQRVAGAGKGLIAKRLNAAGVKKWGGHGKADGPWSATYVGRILVNRAVIGEWQPFRQSRKDKVRTPSGEPISGYYPRIVSDADFARANENRSKHQMKHQGRGFGLSNLLGTVARCGACGGQMVALGSAKERINKDGSVSRHYFLYCGAAKNGTKACVNQQGWTYDKIERPLLDHILSLAMDDIHFAEADHAEYEAAVYTERAKLGEISERMARLLDMVEAGDEVAGARYKARRVELDQAKAKLAEAEKVLAAKRGATDAAAHTLRVKEVRTQMSSADAAERFQARLRVKTALGEIIESITFSMKDKSVTVLLKDRVRMFVIRDGEITRDFDWSDHPARHNGRHGEVRVLSGGVETIENRLEPEDVAAVDAYLERRLGK
jgi:DNA invertase Pin-like site-specific DNA recombinase